MLKKALLGLLVVIVLVVAAALTWADRHAEQVTAWAIAKERSRAGLHKEVIHVADGGINWHLLTGGPRDAEPVVLIHGFGAEKDNWDRTAARLTPTMRLVIPDLIGFGDSDKPVHEAYRIPAQVARLHTLLQQMGIGPAHFAGNSMGGWVAATYAATYPDEVKSLWLLDSAGVEAGIKSEMFDYINSGHPLPLVVKSPGDFDARMRWVFVHPPFVPRAIKKVLAQRAIENAELHANIRQQLYGVSPMLDTVLPGSPAQKIPALIVWGEKDRVLHPDAAAVLAKLLPNSKLILMPDTGHSPMLEKPADSARDYIAWRQSLTAASPVTQPPVK